MRSLFGNWPQSNLNSSNIDVSFTMVNFKTILCPYDILLIAQEKTFMGIFLFYHEIVRCARSLESPHGGDSNEYTQHTIIV